MLLQNVEESVYPGSDISYNSIREKTVFLTNSISVIQGGHGFVNKKQMLAMVLEMLETRGSV